MTSTVELNSLLLTGVVVATALLTGMMRWYAIRFQIMDVPNERSSHTQVTPRGGGAAIVLVFLAIVAALFTGGHLAFHGFLALFGGGLMIAGIGFLDDHYQLPARWRLLAHFVAGGWAVWWLGGLSPVPLGSLSLNLGLLGDLGAVVTIVWLLNLYNFMDGIDGIAGGETVTVAASAAGLLWWQGDGNSALVCAVVAASGVGFLMWNWPPARIFMGDVGSSFLGYLFGVLMVWTSVNNALSAWVWLILMGVFVVDSTATLIRRMRNGERWYEAHRSHTYQRLSRYFGSHSKVTSAVLAVNLLWLLPAAVAASSLPQHAWWIALLALLPLWLLTQKVSQAIAAS